MFQYWTALGISEPPSYSGAPGTVSPSRKLASFRIIQVRRADFLPSSGSLALPEVVQRVLSGQSRKESYTCSKWWLSTELECQRMEMERDDKKIAKLAPAAENTLAKVLSCFSAATSQSLLVQPL